MGVRGSKQHIASRFKAADFFFGQSAEFGQTSKIATMQLGHANNTKQSPPATASASQQSDQLLAVGCEDGAVMVYGREGVEMRLYESAPVTPATASTKNSSVIYIAFLPRSLLISVHGSYIKLWSLEAMCEIFTLDMKEVPLQGENHSNSNLGPYVLTSAVLSNEYDSRYCWLGTSQGDVLLFDILRRRMSGYVITRPNEVDAANNNTNASSVSNTLIPSVTALAQLPSDSSQLLIGYSNDIVITWHISTRKLHRSYKRSACGGVTALAWESGSADGSRPPAEHFVVGYRNGLIVVWRRKYHHSPHAQFFLSSAHGPRYPINCLRWSARTFGFFASGGHLQSGSSEPIETGGVVFVSGAKFEHRKLCTLGGEPLPPPTPKEDGENNTTTAIASPPVTSIPYPPSTPGVREFVQVLMTKPLPPNANPPPTTPNGQPVKSQTTPLFVCLEHDGSVRVHFPTVQPSVPPLPPSHLHELPLESCQILSAASTNTSLDSHLESAPMRQLLNDLRHLTPNHRPWLTMIRTSLSQQHLWPLTGGIDSSAMHRIENEEEKMFRKMNIDGTTSTTPAFGEDNQDTNKPQPLPALLITTHGEDQSIRLSDVTSPFQVDLLAHLALAPIFKDATVRITTTYFCVPRRELIVGTSTGEIMLFRMQRATPPATATATSAPAVESAAASSTSEQATASTTSETETSSASSTSVSTEAPAAVPSSSAPLSPKADIAATATPSVDTPSTAIPSTAPAAEHAPTSASAMSSSSTSSAPSPTPSMDWTFTLVHRIAFSNRPIRTILYSVEVSKYVIIDSVDSFTFFRPDTGVTMKQVIPNAHITAAHFSTEALVKPKSQ